MSRNTSIQWCDDTVNPTMGCDGCELWREGVTKCYAGILHKLRGGHKGFAPTFEEVTEFPGRMATAAKWKDLTGTTRVDKPWLAGLPRLLFVSDMSDALSAVVGFEYLRQEIIDIVRSENGMRHRWLWLTKRPGRMAEFSRWLAEQGIAWPQNLWAGTSVTTQGTVSRVRELANVGDATTRRFVSVEPQWEAVTFGDSIHHVKWVIQGGESGKGAKPFDTAWIDPLRAECREAQTAFFLKQLGKNVIHDGQPLKPLDGHGGEWDEWPEAFKTRQMPDFTIGANGSRVSE